MLRTPHSIVAACIIGPSYRKSKNTICVKAPIFNKPSFNHHLEMEAVEPPEGF